MSNDPTRDSLAKLIALYDADDPGMQCVSADVIARGRAALAAPEPAPVTEPQGQGDETPAIEQYDLWCRWMSKQMGEEWDDIDALPGAVCPRLYAVYCNIVGEPPPWLVPVPAVQGPDHEERLDAAIAQLHASMDSEQRLLEEKAALAAENASLRAALTDMLAGWRYIRQSHGDLYGVGWERCETNAASALAASPPAPSPEQGTDGGGCKMVGMIVRMPSGAEVTVRNEPRTRAAALAARPQGSDTPEGGGA